MRNVAVVTTSYPAFEGDPSGHFVEAEARRLAESANVTVVTAGPAASRTTGDDGILVHRIKGGTAFGWPGVASRLRENPLRALSTLRWTRAARKTLRALGPLDRVVAHWAVPSAFPISDDLGAPLEAVSHGGDVRLLCRMPAVARHAIVVRLLNQLTVWRFVSDALREELAASLLPHERARLMALSTVVPARVSFPDVSARSTVLRADALGGSEERLVVCVGRLVASKTFNRVLTHVARETERGAPSRVVVVGDGPERARLQQQAKELGVNARFVGMTTREDALAWIGAADALLHASQKEGLSTVVREAESLGVPVVMVG